MPPHCLHRRLAPLPVGSSLASPRGGRRDTAPGAMAAAVAAAVRRRDENRREGDDGDAVVRTATKTTVAAEDLLPPRLDVEVSGWCFPMLIPRRRGKI